MNIFTQLFCLKKVCEKVWFKEYYLVKQSLCELEAKKKKKNNLEAELLV